MVDQRHLIPAEHFLELFHTIQPLRSSHFYILARFQFANIECEDVQWQTGPTTRHNDAAVSKENRYKSVRLLRAMSAAWPHQMGYSIISSSYSDSWLLESSAFLHLLVGWQVRQGSWRWFNLICLPFPFCFTALFHLPSSDICFSLVYNRFINDCSAKSGDAIFCIICAGFY